MGIVYLAGVSEVVRRSVSSIFSGTVGAMVDLNFKEECAFTVTGRAKLLSLVQVQASLSCW